MSLEKIYASKLFRAHSNKAKIQAAIQNPVNSELVQQLREYLDDEYIRPEYLEPETHKPEVEPSVEQESSEGEGAPSTPSAAPSTPHHSSAPSPVSFDEPSAGEPEGEEPLDEELSEVLETPPSETEEVEVEESTKTAGKKIEASISLNATEDQLQSIFDVLKGTLNGREDTSGVCRILLKSDTSELWIHYNDDTNLNNVMESVIQVLNASGYTSLEFNRLARTQNAIVFTVNQTSEEIKPVETEEE